MNAVQKAYADIEARVNEPDENTGTFQTRDEFEAQGGDEEQEGDRPEAAAIVLRKKGLKKSYGNLFRSGFDPERIEFEAAGNPCWVDLAPMGRDKKNALLSSHNKALQSGQKNALTDYTVALVSQTVVGFCLWHQPHNRQTGEPLDWQPIRSGAGPDQIAHQFRQMGDALEWWDDLVWECNRINGLLPDEPADSGN